MLIVENLEKTEKCKAQKVFLVILQPRDNIVNIFLTVVVFLKFIHIYVFIYTYLNTNIIQLPLEQHGFELCGSTQTWILFLFFS